MNKRRIKKLISFIVFGLFAMVMLLSANNKVFASGDYSYDIYGNNNVTDLQDGETLLFDANTISYHTVNIYGEGKVLVYIILDNYTYWADSGKEPMMLVPEDTIGSLIVDIVVYGSCELNGSATPGIRITGTTPVTMVFELSDSASLTISDQTYSCSAICREDGSKSNITYNFANVLDQDAMLEYMSMDSTTPEYVLRSATGSSGSGTAGEHDHVWGEPTYEWVDDDSRVIARATCTVEGCDEPLFEESYVEVSMVNLPTCTEPGLAIHYAYFNNEYFTTQEKEVVLQTIGHHIEYYEPQEATCSREGFEGGYRCLNCGKCFSDLTGQEEIPSEDLVIPKSSHVFEHIEGYAATCEQEGVLEHYHCTNCERIYSDENGENELQSIVIPALGHNWGEPTYEWIEGGEELVLTRVCLNNSEHIDSRIVNTYAPSNSTIGGTEVFGHDSNIYASDKTTIFFEEDYSTDHVIYVSGTGYVTINLLFDNYKYSAAASGTMCMNIVLDSLSITGLGINIIVYRSCVLEGNTYPGLMLPNDIPVMIYFFMQEGSSIKFADNAYSCFGIGNQNGNNTNLGYDLNNVKNANEIFETLRSSTNIYPSYTLEYADNGDQTLPITEEGHTHTWGIPTYEWNSNYTKVVAISRCTDCDEIMSEVVYTEYEILKEATCTETGLINAVAVFKNNFFERQEKQGELPLREHEIVFYGEREATCEQTGNIPYYGCQICGKYFDGMYGANEISADEVLIAKLPHDFDHYDGTPATCEQEGVLEHYLCTNCGRIYSDENGENELQSIVIPATGHNWGEEEYIWEEDTLFLRRVCLNDSEHIDSRIIDNYIPSSASSDSPSIIGNESNLYVEDGTIITFNENIVYEHSIYVSGTGNVTINLMFSNYQYFAGSYSGSMTIRLNSEGITSLRINIIPVGENILQGNTHPGLRLTSDVDVIVAFYMQEGSTIRLADERNQRAAICNEQDGTYNISYELYNVENKTTKLNDLESGVTDITLSYADNGDKLSPIGSGHTHSWGEVTYEWNSDFNRCAAICRCTECDEMMSEVVNANVQVTEEATCTHTGTASYIATFENDFFTEQEKQVEIPMLAHEPSPYHDGVLPTCEEEGTRAYYECQICGKYFSNFDCTNELETIVIPKLDHTLTHHDAVPATCTEDGTIEYYECENCERIFADQEGLEEIEETTIPALGHKYGEVVYTWNEDSTELTATRTCLNDPSHVLEERITESTPSSSSDGNQIIGSDSTIYVEDGQTIVFNGDVVFEHSIYVKGSGNVTINLMFSNYQYFASMYSGSMTIRLNSEGITSLRINIIPVGENILQGNTHPGLRLTSDVGVTIAFYMQEGSRIKFADEENQRAAICNEQDSTYNISYEFNNVDNREAAFEATESGSTVLELSYADNGDPRLPASSGDTHTHSFTTPVYEWNSDNTRVAAISKCSVCGESLVEIVDVEIIREESTCTTKGIIIYTATFRNSEFVTQEKEEEIPFSGHDFIYHEAKPATFDEIGWDEYYTCSRCDYSTYNERPKLERPDTSNPEAAEEFREQATRNIIDIVGDQEQLEDIIDNIGQTSVEVLADIVEVAGNAYNDINDMFKDLPEDTKVEVQPGVSLTKEEAIEIVQSATISTIVIASSQDTQIEAAVEIENMLPENSGINIGAAVSDFYQRVLSELLSAPKATPSASHMAFRLNNDDTDDVSEGQGIDYSVSAETYKNAIDFVETSVNNMTDAALRVRQCSGEALKSTINHYISGVSVQSFRDFDREKADREFAEAAYRAILISLQETVQNTLTEAYEKAKENKSGRALQDLTEAYNQEMEQVSHLHFLEDKSDEECEGCFEDIVIEIMRLKYISILNNKRDNKEITDEIFMQYVECAKDEETFAPVYKDIFFAWATGKEYESEVSISLQELSDAAIENTSTKINPPSVEVKVSKMDWAIIGVVFGSLALLGISYIFIFRKRGV